jgi:hypothetical protein
MKSIGENKFELQCDVRTLGTLLIMYAANLTSNDANNTYSIIKNDIRNFLTKSKKYED